LRRQIAERLNIARDLHDVLGAHCRRRAGRRGGLRTGDAATDVWAPAPGLAGVTDVVTTARRTGLTVKLEVSGDRPAFATISDLTACRVIQESLTNVIRHARVLLADDQRLVRTGRTLLELPDYIEVVGEADDCAEAVDLARQTRPDVVLVDVRMPLVDGMEATRQSPRPRAASMSTSSTHR